MNDHLYCSDWSEIFRSDFGAKYWSWARLRVILNRSDQAEDLIGSNIIRLVPDIWIEKSPIP